MDVKIAIWMYMDVKNLKNDSNFFTHFWSNFTKIFQILTESVNDSFLYDSKNESF